MRMVLSSKPPLRAQQPPMLLSNRMGRSSTCGRPAHNQTSVQHRYTLQPSRRQAAAPLLRPCGAAASQAPSSPATSIPQLKSQIISKSGQKYGHDLDAAARADVEAAVAQLVEAGPEPAASAEALAGSTWTLVYTTSDGTSSGKVGPFITEVEQAFPADQVGVYYNLSRLGFVSAKLRGEFQATRPDRIDLEFKDIALSVGPLQLARKEFPPGGMRGYWKLSYCDNDFRVFYTNKGNLFVLKKIA